MYCELFGDMWFLCGLLVVRYVGYVYYFIVDDSILNMSVGSLFESGYDGDMEDEGDLNVDEEFCSELVDD